MGLISYLTQAALSSFQRKVVSYMFDGVGLGSLDITLHKLQQRAETLLLIIGDLLLTPNEASWA
jgi:hypothetical protein